MGRDDEIFKGNASLPPADATYAYNVEELREFVKCSQDPVYFIKTYMKIIQVDKGLVPFEMWEFQENMVRCYHENRFSITMCSRQVGKSTTVIGYFLWYILFNVNVRCCISANKQKTAVDLLGRLKLAYENLPRFLQQGVVRWARMEIELANGATCFAAATSSSAVRGGSYNILLLDEFAFVPENIANEFYASTFPTITSGKTTKLIIVSTPNGMNLFHKFWAEAQAGDNDFKPLFVHWSQVPGRDDAWKEETARNIGGPEKFAQEYECSFLSTSYTLIRSQVLQTLTHSQPIETSDTGYAEFLPPDKSRAYVMTVDTASGQGLDYSTFVIVDVSEMPYRIAATYANNRITTMEFPQVIMQYAKRYFMPWLMVEVMDIGRDVAFILSRDHEYERLMTAVTEKRLGQRLTFNAKMNRHLGLRMTAGVKRSGCAVLKTLVENHHLMINDYRIVQQLSVFVQKGSLYMAETGHHDDLVMPLVMLGWISLQPNFAEVTGTRALDAYTQIITESKDNPVPIVVDDEHPMPLGVFGNSNDDDDPYWVLR
jgi:hypothetical protein